MIDKQKLIAKQISNWMQNDIAKFLNQNKMGFGDLKLEPESLGILAWLVVNGLLDKKEARDKLKKRLEELHGPC